MAEFLQRFTWLDLVVFAILVRTAFVGGTTGLATEIFKTVGLLIGLVLSFRYHGVLAGWAGHGLPIASSYLQILAFLSILLAAVWASSLIRGVSSAIVTIKFVPQVERYGGILLGIARGALFASLLLFAASLCSNEVLQKSLHTGGMIVPRIQSIAPFLYDGLGRLMPGILAPGGPRLP